MSPLVNAPVSHPRPATIRSVAAIGDAGDPNSWSGIPYHFWQAGRRAGFLAEPIRLRLDELIWQRRFWALGRVMLGRRPSGFQYTPACLGRLERQIPKNLLSSEVISFNQHFPRAATVRAAGGRISYYIDATFAALSSGRGLQLDIADDIVAEARELERENLRLADRVVAMARWAADSLINECGVPPEKVSVVLPGANLELPTDWSPPARPNGRIGKERTFVLGFVGKDWERKGLPLLCDVRDELARRGWNVVVRAAGDAPAAMRDRPGIEFVGFIDKRNGTNAFVDFLAYSDFGCLFSQREALGISTLEFLRVGVPVAGFAVEGPADTLPPDAGLRFSTVDTVETITDAFDTLLRDPDSYAVLVSNARKYSRLVTWDRCVEELQSLWNCGAIDHSLRLWASPTGLTSVPCTRL
ncbi:MAG: glycosyltransferase family 4 protein [Pirellulales bacterium]